MNWHHEPAMWAAFPVECLWYLFPGILVHLFALLISLPCYAALALARVRWLPQFTTVLLFQALLLATAMAANGVWSCSIWGRLYWSVDYTSDFSPFYPIAKQVITYSWGEDMHGALNGISLTTLNLVWGGFAFAVWAGAFVLTRRIIERRNGAVPNKTSEGICQPADGLSKPSTFAFCGINYRRKSPCGITP